MMSDLERRDDGSALLEDCDWVLLKIPSGYFYQECCGCKLTHRVHVRGHSELVLRYERIERIPKEDVSADLAIRGATPKREAGEK